MSDQSQEFDILLSSILQQPSTEGDDARLSEQLPLEVTGEDLQLLQLALDIRRELAPDKPTEEFLRTSEIRLTNQIRARVTRIRSNPASKRKVAAPFWRRFLQPVPILASLALVIALTLGSVGVVNASAASLPGDTLYPVKRGWQQARLALSLTDEGDAKLLAAFASERVTHIQELSNMDREADLDQAVDEYLQLAEQLSLLATDPDSEAAELQGELANNVLVLQRVLEQVPAQAQPAIQRAIDRSLAREEARQDAQGEKPGQAQGKPGDQPGQNQNQGSEQNQRRAEQIANQYEVSVEAVEQQLEGSCLGDWQCVREHFRNQQQNQRFAEQIARQNGTSVEAVLQVFEGACNFEWKCVREHFRGERPGGGPPEDLPNNN